MKCSSCGDSIEGRARKYCNPACRPSFYQRKAELATVCQVCGKTMDISNKAGRPRKNCSDKCRSKVTRKYKPKKSRKCDECSTFFESASKAARFCSKDCRTKNYARPEVLAKIYQREKKKKYPDGTRTHDCGWCGLPRTFVVGESVVNAFHEECREEATKAKNRIKSVKRIKGIQVARLSADQILEHFGSVCYLCKKDIDASLPRTSRYGLTIDHVVPLSKGGLDTMENLRPTHWICNILKSNKTLEEYRAESR